MPIDWKLANQMDLGDKTLLKEPCDNLNGLVEGVFDVVTQKGSEKTKVRIVIVDGPHEGKIIELYLDPKWLSTVRAISIAVGFGVEGPDGKIMANPEVTPHDWVQKAFSFDYKRSGEFLNVKNIREFGAEASIPKVVIKTNKF